VNGEKIPPLPVDPAREMAEPRFFNGIETRAEFLDGEGIALGQAQEQRADVTHGERGAIEVQVEGLSGSSLFRDFQIVKVFFETGHGEPETVEPRLRLFETQSLSRIRGRVRVPLTRNDFVLSNDTGTLGDARLARAVRQRGNGACSDYAPAGRFDLHAASLCIVYTSVALLGHDSQLE